MTSEKDITTVIRLVKKEVEKFQDPIVTEVGEVTRSPYQVLISCILSLRTRDETTAKASERLFTLAKTPKEIVKLSTKQIEKAIYPVGFYRTKAKRIKEISQKILQEYKGKVPENFDELMQFKGVGRKTANIVMVYGFHKEALPIDVHCWRIPNRLGWTNAKTPIETEKVLSKLLPRRYWRDFNDTFVTFGQNICKPIGPKCNICPVKTYCKYYKDIYLKNSKNKT